jgi:RecB family endonuclease NucS
MDAKKINEKELYSHLESFLRDRKLRLLAREVRIGAYRLDAVATDPSGALVVIELKVNASTKTLGQLLLYPHALRKAIKDREVQPPHIRALLITTFLDSNVQEVVRELADQVDIEFLVCTSVAPDTLRLVDPENAGGQFWDQSESGSRKIEPVLAYLVGV